MSNKTQALGAAVLGALLASAACSGNDSNTGGSNAGEGGTAGLAGGFNNAGRGGSTHAGAGGKSGGVGAAGEESVGVAGDTDHGGSAGSAGGPVIGTGGEAGAVTAPQCPLCPSGVCLPSGTCVECLPTADNCPSGTVCGSHNTCVVGCKTDGTSCASGVCESATTCQSCIDDTECGGGTVCGNGQCAAACTTAQEGTTRGCGGGLTCCSRHCIDEQTDTEHCGACGAACSDGQFCGLDSACNDSGAGGAGGAAGAGASSDACVACHPTTLANLCSVPRVAVILDGQEGNENPGRAIAAAIVANCDPKPALREVSQNSADALNPASGRPVAGAHELLVAAGGSVFARLLDYVDKQRVSPIYFNFENMQTLQFRNTATDKVIASGTLDEDHDAHDYFAIQFMREKTSGSLILNAEGFWLSGTNAATLFFQQAVAPHLQDFTKSWYVYDWTDLNADKLPQLEEIKPVASGT